MIKSKTFCILPWIHLATHPNGGVSLCCSSNHTNAISWAKKENSNSLLTLDNDSIYSIMNSKKFIEVRSKMLDNQKPIECEGCWLDEENGIKSKRLYENERWKHIIDQIDAKEIINELNLSYVELRLGNVCNSACLTCNSYSSTKWYPDEKKLSNKLKWFQLRNYENFKWFENENFYVDLANSSKNVEEIYINGGEPTLIKQHFRYLELLIDNQIAENVHLVYSLNMIDIPDSLLILWKKFKKVTVNASIDDFDTRNYYIRFPTKWENVKLSIDKLNACDNIEWHVTQTVSIFNVCNLHELSEWLNQNYNKTPHHNYVLYPDYLSLIALPNEYKENAILSNLGKLPDYQLNELKSKLDITQDPILLDKTREFILSIDEIRGLTYKDFIPELENIL